MNKYILKKNKYLHYLHPNGFNYRGTGMPYHQWLALKVIKTLLKEKRYPIHWKEHNNGDTVVITFY